MFEEKRPTSVDSYLLRSSPCSFDRHYCICPEPIESDMDHGYIAHRKEMLMP